MDSLFGVKLHTSLKCEESGESIEVGTLCSVLQPVEPCAACSSPTAQLQQSATHWRSCRLSACKFASMMSQEDTTAYSLKCNISIEVNDLAAGMHLALKDDREKRCAGCFS